MARFQIVNEVCTDDPEVMKRIKQELPEQVETATPSGARLCLQWGRYIYEDGGLETGYRFIWRKPDGTLQAARGQARIPSLKLARILMETAEKQGWGDYLGS